MDQNTNELKWELISPVKFIDKEYGEVEVLGSGLFTYEVHNQEAFNAAAAASNMDADTYAKGILLTLIIEEIGKFSGKMVLSLSSLIKGDNILNNANSKIINLGFSYTKVVVESIKLTDESEKKMKEIETTKIKAAITGKEIVNNDILKTEVQSNSENNNVDGENLSEKGPNVLGIILFAVVIAAVIIIFF